MTKRKAELDLDEWLRLAPALSRMETARTTTLADEVVLEPTPIAEVSPSTVETNMTPTLPVDGTTPQEDNNEWFWLLLEQSGFKRW